MPKKSICFSLFLGHFFEQYDKALYGLLIPILAPHFFKNESPVISYILAFAIFPAGFAFKPLGAFLFGRVGDRLGKKEALTLSLLGMSFITSLMGIVPCNPLWIFSGRLLQNFFSSGETTGATLLLLEKAPPSKKSFLSSLFDFSGILGIITASSLVTLLTYLNRIETHWRLLFLVGGMTGFVGLWIRRSIPKDLSKTYSKIHFSHLKSHTPILLKIALITGLSHTIYSYSVTFLNSYLPLCQITHLKENYRLSTVILIMDLVLLPLFGLLLLKVPKEKLMRTATLYLALLAPLLFLLMKTPYIAYARILLVTLGVMLAAPYHHWIQEMAPTENSYTLIAIGKSLGSGLLGASAGMIGMMLYKGTGLYLSPAFYLSFLCCLSYLSLREKAPHPIARHLIPA